MYLTIKNLCDICDLMGVSTQVDQDADMSAEVWIGNGSISSDSGEPDYHGLIAHCAEYPEEGAIALEEAKHEQ